MHLSPTSSIYLHPALCKTLNVIRTKIFAFNWAISPNLGRKIQNCSLWLKTGLHGILEVLIPNPDLNFWNSDPEINFWVNLGRKTKKFPFCLKIETLGYLDDSDFYSEISCLNFQTLIHFCANVDRKIQSCLFCPNICTKSISRMLILIPTLVSQTFNPNFFFWENLD